jgi:hypothetical protein
VTFTFLGADSPFNNTVGIYSVAADGTIIDVRILFPNTSPDVLVPGISAASFDVVAGERIGVFAIADGFDRNDFDAMGDGHFAFLDEFGAAAKFDSIAPTMVFVGGDGAITPIAFEPGGGVFHSLANELNPVPSARATSGLDEDGALVVAFDIQPDAVDFDDIVFRVTVDRQVETALDPIAVSPTLDLDDVDSVGLTRADVSLAGAAGDRLAIDDALAASLGIGVAPTDDGFDLTGLGSFADYEAILASLALANDNPTAGGRTVSITVFDTAGASSTVDIAIDVDEVMVEGGAGFTAFADAGESFALADVG